MSGENFIEHNHETEHTREINLFQLEVAMEWDENFPSDDQKFEQWAALYSPQFRKILDDELDADAHFWVHFQDLEFREVLKSRLKSKLYEVDQETMRETA